MIELVIDQRRKDLGGFEVGRVLPFAKRRMVGPFVFFDHMGPADFPPGVGIDVRPHPHIGLATVTYLFEGAIEHRDSLGSVQRITAGAVNWMTAGRGIVHSERSPQDMRRTGGRMQGIQTWLALPRELEGCEPAFVHHPAASLPVIEMPGVTMRLIAGSAFDRTSPVAVASSMFYIAVEMEAGASFVLPDEYAERAVYPLSGDISINEGALAAGSMAVLNPSEPVTIQALSPTRLMLLGGAPLDGERFLWWNFVASDRAAIEEASERWRCGGFDMVPGETEFIPLPDRPKAPEPFS